MASILAMSETGRSKVSGAAGLEVGIRTIKGSFAGQGNAGGRDALMQPEHLGRGSAEHERTLPTQSRRETSINDV